MVAALIGTELFMAGLVIGVIGLFLGCVIGLVVLFFSVKSDDRIEKITELLPGANCGGCGYAGCGDFARAIVEQGVDVASCVRDEHRNDDDSVACRVQQLRRGAADGACTYALQRRGHSPAYSVLHPRDPSDGDVILPPLRGSRDSERRDDVSAHCRANGCGSYDLQCHNDVVLPTVLATVRAFRLSHHKSTAC